GHRESDAALVERLKRLASVELVSALRAQDFQSFGEALFDYNRLAGEAFANVQGGVYSSPGVEDLIRFIRSSGTTGVAQSSWGPAVAAIADSQSHSDELIARLSRQMDLPPMQKIVTRGCNRGALVEAF